MGVLGIVGRKILVLKYGALVLIGFNWLTLRNSGEVS